MSESEHQLASSGGSSVRLRGSRPDRRAYVAVRVWEARPETRGGKQHEPATVEPIKGTDVNRVTLTKEAAERLGIETAPIRQVGGRKVVPDAAVVYDPEGKTFTYSSSEAADLSSGTTSPWITSTGQASC